MNPRVAVPVLASVFLFGCGETALQDPPEPGALDTLSQGVSVNTNPGFLVVYNVNYENLPTAEEAPCAGDWKDLIYYMKDQTYSPDVLIVHQMSGAGQAANLAQFMQENLPGLYDFVIAEANPEPQASPCGPPKFYQTNAIIYRTGRLQPITGTRDTWQVFKGANGSCVMNNQSRSIGVRMAFTDLITHKKVILGSSHWPTNQEGPSSDPGCAEANIARTDAKVRGTGTADLIIWGVDSNESDRAASGDFKQWYRQANSRISGATTYRWNDPIYEACGGGRACLDNNGTVGPADGARIDFLFFNAAASSSTGHTVSYDEGDAAARQFTGEDNGALHYSGHRAIRARIHYP
ncbi:hypothetical protein HPC49_20815 [Pyxidicoccus fallax]|uniref:Endonuclease/exonuclease/phosphatase domain-containing protein n=1 Tax=Pyxidicoccus fallax TaxID=394095 RepID=A0A848LAY8_9BACT|nr:hypothetical protein [Pyxidicoccus fallax]NMO15656.1 hypothetical protein [Pyxidicoccus fallax]NPC80655.1 hypothetical protein [Pyxidicoccus fallax]